MRRKIITFGIMYLTVLFAFAQTSVLQYDAYLEQIKERLPEMKLNATKVTTAENNVLAAKGISDISLSLKTGAVGKQGSGYPNAANGFDIGVGADSVVAASGTRLSVQISQDAYFKSQEPKGTYYAPMVAVSVTQPLLHNVLGKLDRYPIKDAESALAVARLQRLIDDSGVLVAYKKLYFEWIMLEKLTDNFAESVKSAEDFENQIYRRMQSGLADNDAYQNARWQTMQYRDSYDEYRENLKIVKTAINYFISLENKLPNINGWNIFLDTALKETLVPAIFDVTVYADISGLLHGRALDALDAMKNNMLPKLDLIGNVSLASPSAGGNYVTSFGDISNVDYVVGLRFSYPLGNKASKAKLLEAQNTLNAIVYESAQMKRNFIINMEKICGDFNMSKDLLKSKKEQMSALQSRLSTQTKKLEQGRLEADDIIRTRLDMMQAQIEILNLEYRIITAAFDYESLMAVL